MVFIPLSLFTIHTAEADARVHLEMFHRIVAYGKPTFIDKPLAVSYAEAKEIIDFISVERNHDFIVSNE